MLESCPKNVAVHSYVDLVTSRARVKTVWFPFPDGDTTFLKLMPLGSMQSFDPEELTVS